VGVLASGRTGRYVYRQHRAPRRHLAGWNVQISPKYVVGVEGDFAYANETATFHGSSYPANLLFGAPSLPFGASPNDAFHVRTTWDGSARLRFGWLINPSTMLYLTGGLAWAHLEAMSSCSPVPTPNVSNCASGNYFGGTLAPTNIIHSATKLGWTAGSGIDVSLGPQWVVEVNIASQTSGIRLVPALSASRTCEFAAAVLLRATR
jgi:outer membrane immunogenic protein